MHSTATGDGSGLCRLSRDITAMLLDNPFIYQQYRDTGAMFPSDISDDPWVLYHGTSGTYSESIEHDGLCWTENLYTRADLVSLLRIFCALRWEGVHGHLQALLYYTKIDFGSDSCKPIFLASSAYHASKWAQRNHAGGEPATAIRGCFNDLLEYVADPILRDKAKPLSDYYFKAWPELEDELRSRDVLDLSDAARVHWVAE